MKFRSQQSLLKGCTIDFQEVAKSIGTQNALVLCLKAKIYDYDHAKLSKEEKKDLRGEIEELATQLEQTKGESTSKVNLMEEYRKVVQLTEKNGSASKEFAIDGHSVSFVGKQCGEIIGAGCYNTVDILLDGNPLYEILPSQGVWSIASNVSGLKLINTGEFEDPEDAIGYIEYQCS